jgi:hypothetical protein
MQLKFSKTRGAKKLPNVDIHGGGASREAWRSFAVTGTQLCGVRVGAAAGGDTDTRSTRVSERSLTHA